MKNHCWNFSILPLLKSFAFPKFLLLVRFRIFRTINWEHRVLTCITIMEHFDQLCIPAFHKSVVTVELHLISFSVVVLLNPVTSVVKDLCILMPNSFRNDGRWAGLSWHFLNILIEFLVLLPVILVPETKLIINDYSQSLGISGLWNERFQCGNEFTIAVWGNANKDFPIFGNRMWFDRLIYHLAEVDCDEVIVPLVWGHHLVQHLFTLEKDSTT